MDPIPITILAGSDRRRGRLPAGHESLHALAAYKGVHLKVAGRPVVAVLVERLHASGGFGPVSIAGPAELHRALALEAELVDTDGSLADNLRAALAHHRRAERVRAAFLACDVLPGIDELIALRSAYEQDAPCAAWYPLVRCPADETRLGSFAWKPRYAVRAAEERALLNVLPGHLAILEPAALRQDLLLRVLAVAYATRNTAAAGRVWTMARGVAPLCLRQDLARARRLRVPSFTWNAIATAAWMARAIGARPATLSEIERRLGRVVLAEERARDAGTPRGLCFPLVDTQEEADELELEGPGAPAGG